MADSNARPDEKPNQPIHIDAEDARAGEIVLRKRWQRTVFIAAPVGMVALFVIVAMVVCGFT